MRRSAIQAELRQSRPFRSTAQEATIALLRTASVINRVIGRAVEPFDLSLSQYNALRIIRGAGPQGIATLAIRERMIEEGTPITRVLDRLEERGCVRRDRGTDRRQVLCVVTKQGAELLARMDPIVNEADEEAMAALSGDELETLIALVDAIRLDNTDRGAPRTMRMKESATRVVED